MKKITFVAIPLFLALMILSIMFFLENTSGKGALQVTSTPKATVYLNGEKIGNTPFCKCEPDELIKIGEYTIKIIAEKDEFQPFEEKITITKSTLAVVDKEFSEGAQGSSSIINLISLTNKKQTELTVVSFPNNADVFLDNKAAGTTPLSIRGVKPSEHTLSITKDGYKDKSFAIKTTEGYKLTVLTSLGVIPVSSPSGETQTATSSALPINKVVILDTPTGFLRVRSTSSTASQEIDRVLPGETYEMITEGEGWFEIKLEDKKTGWISSKYAEKQTLQP